MRYSEIKTVKNFCESLYSNPDWREVVENIEANESDFEVDNVRFINSSDIDSIQQDELQNDLYCLGCFNASFLAEVMDMDTESIEDIQKAGAHEALGKMIVRGGFIEELQSKYSGYDGYGHHFNSYDFGEEDLRVNGETFHVFDNH